LLDIRRPEVITADRRRKHLREQRDRFVTLWVASAASNRLGRMCFLGGPFMTKVWARYSPWRLSRITNLIVDFIPALPAAAIVTYLTLLILWGELWLFVSPVLYLFDWGTFPSVEPDPWAWAWWLQIGVGLYLLVLCFAFAKEFSDEGLRRDFNPYFNTNRVGEIEIPKEDSSRDKCVPIDTLVTTAGLFDEVFLGFSSEPIVYGGLEPQLFPLGPSRFSWLPPKSALEEQEVKNPFRQLLANVLYVAMIVPWTFVAIPILIWIWRRHLIRRLVHIISSFAYGIPSHEFGQAMIAPANRIGLPGFFKEHVWDVTRMLLETPPVRSYTVDARASRYAFLWDADELAHRTKNSWIGARLDELAKPLAKRYRWFPDVQLPELKKRVAITSMVLEERMRELIGAVELTHSAYYTNPRIITAIAEFIATGRAPEEAEARVVALQPPPVPPSENSGQANPQHA
jgi:hypothetical protein